MSFHQIMKMKNFFVEPAAGYSSCIVNVLAHACGYINSLSYYKYMFLSSIYDNWNQTEYTNQSALKKIEYITEQLKLKFNRIPVQSREEFVQAIQEYLANNTPLILFLTYVSTPYHRDYHNKKRVDNSFHTVIISGYDEEQQLLQIEDNYYVDDKISKVYNRPFVFTIYQTVDQIYQAFLEAQEIYKNNNKNLGDLFYLEKTDENCADVTHENIGDIFDLMSTFLSLNMEDNELGRIIAAQDMKQFIEDEYLLRLRFHAIDSISYVFLKAAEFIQNTALTAKVEETLENYKNNLNLILHRLTRAAITNRNFSEVAIQSANTLAIQDDNLYRIAQDLYEYCSALLDDTLVNFALNAKVEVDSEAVYTDGFPSFVFAAERLVDGKWIDSERDAWYSAGETMEHWAMIELDEAQTIKKVIIHHSNLGLRFITISFTLLVSMDGEEWTVVDEVEENGDEVTVHEVENLKGKYIKLAIHNPGSGDRHARISEIEVLGTKTAARK